MCILCGEEVNINGQFAECTNCGTIQLAAECEASYSARVMLKDATGTSPLSRAYRNFSLRHHEFIKAKMSVFVQGKICHRLS